MKKHINEKNIIRLCTIILISGFILGCAILSKERYENLSINKLIVTNSCTSKPDVINVIERIENIPNKVMRVLLNNNIKIDYIYVQLRDALGDEDLFKYDNSAAFQGDKSRIIIECEVYKDLNIKLLKDKYRLSINTFHEIGHAFDYDYILKKDYYSYSRSYEFIEITKQEATKISNTGEFGDYDLNYKPDASYEFYYASNSYEYFSQSFGFYFASDESNKFLKDNAPKTYSYIKQITK